MLQRGAMADPAPHFLFFALLMFFVDILTAQGDVLNPQNPEIEENDTGKAWRLLRPPCFPRACF